MIRARLVLALALGTLALTPAPVMAQARKPAPAPARQPTKAELEKAAANYRIFVSALQSDKIPEAMKSVLFVCVYSNDFKHISEATDKLMASRPAADRANPSIIISATAAACGFKPGQMAAPTPAPKK